MPIATSNHWGEIVLKIGRIFFISMLMLMNAACSRQPSNEITLPGDIKAITTPFLEALARGDVAKAEKFIDKGEVDDAREQFADATRTLSTAPQLQPVMIRYKPTIFGQPNKNDVTVLYAAKNDKLWTSVQMRLFRLEGEPYSVEYFYVKNQANMPEELAQGEMLKKWMIYGFGIMAALGLLFVLALIWFVRRKSHIIAPDPVIDPRAVATTLQDE